MLPFLGKMSLADVSCKRKRDDETAAAVTRATTAAQKRLIEQLKRIAEAMFGTSTSEEAEEQRMKQHELRNSFDFDPSFTRQLNPTGVRSLKQELDDSNSLVVKLRAAYDGFVKDVETNGEINNNWFSFDTYGIRDGIVDCPQNSTAYLNVLSTLVNQMYVILSAWHTQSTRDEAYMPTAVFFLLSITETTVTTWAKGSNSKIQMNGWQLEMKNKNLDQGLLYMIIKHLGQSKNKNIAEVEDELESVLKKIAVAMWNQVIDTRSGNTTGGGSQQLPGLYDNLCSLIEGQLKPLRDWLNYHAWVESEGSQAGGSGR